MMAHRLTISSHCSDQLEHRWICADNTIDIWDIEKVFLLNKARVVFRRQQFVLQNNVRLMNVLKTRIIGAPHIM